MRIRPRLPLEVSPPLLGAAVVVGLDQVSVNAFISAYVKELDGERSLQEQPREEKMPPGSSSSGLWPTTHPPAMRRLAERLKPVNA